MFKLAISRSKETLYAIIIGVIIAVVSALIVEFIYTESPPKEATTFSSKVVASKATPQLWSHHKQLTMSAEQCASKGQVVLTELGFNSIVKNGSYVYGNFFGNRAAIKCVAMAEQSFVYIAVAGADVEPVEKLRNEIAWQF